MTKHTPGPWRIDDDPDPITSYFVQVLASEGRIAEVILHSGERAGEGDANARLIAAAPNLRDVAEALILFHSGDPWDGTKRLRWLQLTGADEATTKTLYDLARAAIAKTEDAA